MSNPITFDDIINKKHLLCLFILKNHNILPFDIIKCILMRYNDLRFLFNVVTTKGIPYHYNGICILLTGDTYIKKNRIVRPSDTIDTKRYTYAQILNGFSKDEEIQEDKYKICYIPESLIIKIKRFKTLADETEENNRLDIMYHYRSMVDEAFITRYSIIYEFESIDW